MREVDEIMRQASTMLKSKKDLLKSTLFDVEQLTALIKELLQDLSKVSNTIISSDTIKEKVENFELLLIELSDHINQGNNELSKEIREAFKKVIISKNEIQQLIRVELNS